MLITNPSLPNASKLNASENTRCLSSPEISDTLFSIGLPSLFKINLISGKTLYIDSVTLIEIILAAFIGNVDSPFDIATLTIYR